MAKYELTTEWQSGSLQGYIKPVAPSLLVKLFGQPEEADGYKVSGEYSFKNEEGKIFRLYDWKWTSLYHGEDEITPEEFWASDEPYEFHVGSEGPEGVVEFIADFDKLIEYLANPCPLLESDISFAIPQKLEEL